MDLTRDDYQKVILLVIGALLGAILAVLGNLFIWNWNKPDVRFGTGGAYIHPKLALATVGLKNWGGSDAEKSPSRLPSLIHSAIFPRTK